MHWRGSYEGHLWEEQKEPCPASFLYWESLRCPHLGWVLTPSQVTSECLPHWPDYVFTPNIKFCNGLGVCKNRFDYWLNYSTDSHRILKHCVLICQSSLDSTWKICTFSLCYGLNCVSSKFILKSPSQEVRMCLYLEIWPL
jgi:hypothetical protein